MNSLPRWLLFLAVSMLATACNRTPPTPNEQKPKIETPVAQVQPPPVTVLPPIKDPTPTPPERNPTPLPLLPALPELPDPMADFTFTAKDEKTQKYESALAEALGHMADQNWTDALAAYEGAQAFKDTDFVKSEIAKLKSRIDEGAAAKRTVQDIATILEDGKGKDAADLARKALKEFGDGDASEQLVKLRLQADALEAAAGKEAPDARFLRLKLEGDTALADKNPRAAALAFDQALQIKDDVELRTSFDKTRETLDRYDALRLRAAELRRDPQTYEDALAALQDARAAWDTLQIRQEIDECSALITNRRDNLAVVDFDTHGVVGFGDAGRALAAELLPHFKGRFNLVERGQIAKVLADLKIDDGVVDEPAAQREVGKAARVRYLVIGTVHRLGEAFVQARIVDTRSGLIVQTAKISAPTIPDLLPKAAELAQQLMMTDDEKMAWLDKQARVVRKIEPPQEDAPFPEAPPEPVADQPPLPAPVEALPAAPQFGAFNVRVFEAIPVAPPAAGIVIVPGEAPQNFRYRLLYGSLYWGDHFFRAGHYRAALRYYEFALTLSPGDFAIRLRIERTLRMVPPVVVVASGPPIYRPRVALLDFFVTDPRLPVGIGAWTPRAMAPYFAPQYDLVDPNEVYWFMGNMGMTMNDLVANPEARRWLGRAMGIQYFVVGYIRPGSFHVNTYMIHAEHGYLLSQGYLYAQTPWELKVRLPELAQMTMSREQHNLYVTNRPQFQILLTKGRDAMGRRDFRVAVGFFDDALRLIPGNIEVIGYRQQCMTHEQHVAFEEARRRDYLLRKAAEDEARRRQWALANQAQQQRVQVGVQVALLGAPGRQRIDEQRFVAQNNLVTQAQVALKAKNFTLAVGFFESALKLAPANPPVNPPVPVVANAVLVQQLAEARAQAAAAQQAAAQAQLQAQREADLRQKREQELARAQQKILDDRKKAHEIAIIKQAALDKDFLAAKQQAEVYMNDKKYDAAIASLHAAQRIKQDPLVNAMLHRAMELSAEQSAKTEKQKQDLEVKLKLERDRRLAAEKEAKQNQDLYKQALNAGHKALAERQFDIAQSKYEEAGKLFRTDAVLTGLSRVQTARREHTQKEQADTVAQKHLQKLLSDAKSAMAANNPATALLALAEAKKFAPQNTEVLAQIAQAEQLRDRLNADIRKKGDDAERTKNYDRFLANGKASLKNKKFDEAAVAFNDALKQRPGDAIAAGYLKQATDGSAAIKLADDQAKLAKMKLAQLQADYQREMTEATKALQAQQFAEAQKHFQAALALVPRDAAASQGLGQANAGLQTLAQSQQAYQREMNAGQLALNGKNFAEAETHFNTALKLRPMDNAARQMLANNKQAWDNAKLAGIQQNQTKFNQAVSAGQTALAQKQYAEAQQAFQAALQLKPGDPVATQGLAQVKQALDNQQGAAKQAKTAYSNYMNQANAAANAKNFAESIRLYGEAKKLFPNDQNVALMIQQTNQVWEASKKKVNTPPPPPPPPPPPADPTQKFKQELAKAQTAESQNRWDDAIKAYGDAAKLKPGDPQVVAGINRAQFGWYINQGQNFMNARNYAAAITSFETALRITPNDARAKALLDQAKKIKK